MKANMAAGVTLKYSKRSALSLAAKAQISLETVTPKAHLPYDSDTSSTDSGSDSEPSSSSSSSSSSSCNSQGSTTAANPPTTKPPHSVVPKSLTDENQQEIDFGPIRAIPDELFKKQLLKHVNPRNRFTIDQVRLQRRTAGASHHVVILRLGPPKSGDEYVIKIPITGTKERWTEEYAHNMKCEAMTMDYIGGHTSCFPAPSIEAVETDIDNELGGPYILMSKMPGKGAYRLWYDHDDTEHLNTDCPSVATEKKRVTFLRSLAYCMAQLQKIRFDKIGMLELGDCFKDDDHLDDKPAEIHFYDLEHEKRQPFSSTHEFLTTVVEERCSTNMTLAHMSDEDDEDDGDIKELHHHRGMRKIIDIIFSSPPFASTEEKETFVIRHPDLDLQNILTDDEGNVTGIIDWDGAVTAPRCIGFSALPHFLVHDWLPDFTLDEPPHLSWGLDRYRRIYADVMKEALTERRDAIAEHPEALRAGLEDGKNTYNSALYQAVWASVTRGGSAPDLVNKVLLQLPGLRLLDLDEFQEKLGRGWEAAEQYLKVEIAKVMAPEDFSAD
jgi:aminoglycoside phosphotransferase (APT) family kinase protein